MDLITKKRKIVLLYKRRKDRIFFEETKKKEIIFLKISNYKSFEFKDNYYINQLKKIVSRRNPKENTEKNLLTRIRNIKNFISIKINNKVTLVLCLWNIQV